MAIELECIAPGVGVVYSNIFPRIDFGRLWHRQAYISPSGALVRKQTLIDVDGFEESWALKRAEDLNLLLKIALTDWRFVQAKPGLFIWRSTGQNESGNNYTMAQAEMANLHFIAERSGCDPRVVQRLVQSVRIEYARNLIAEERWEEAKELLKDATPELAKSWLELVGFVKNNHLARKNLVNWLHTLNQRFNAYHCSAQCRLSEQQKTICRALAANETIQ